MPALQGHPLRAHPSSEACRRDRSSRGGTRAGVVGRSRCRHGAGGSAPPWHRCGRLPEFVLLQLTQLIDAAPGGDAWLHENQIRRVPHACTPRSRQRAAAHPHRARDPLSPYGAGFLMNSRLCAHGWWTGSSSSRQNFTADTRNDGEDLSPRPLIERRARALPRCYRTRAHPCTIAITRSSIAGGS